jgi:phosphoglycerol transferase MdoB-like AlkP superfamily enzyme
MIMQPDGSTVFQPGRMTSFETGEATPSGARAKAGGKTRSAFGFMPPIEARIFVLFATLAAVKVALILGMTKHLHEIHWRVEQLEPTWLNYAAFYGAVGIFVSGVWSLGNSCRRAGVRSVRVTNLIVIGLGLLFLFVIGHSGDKNYLHLLMTGVLRWKDLIPYFQLDSFFRMPFLAAWFLAYVLIYYVLLRTGRESQALYWTAGIAGAFAIVALQELTAYRTRLLVADCFGLAMLLSGKRDRPSGLLWLLAPVPWTVFYWLLFKSATPELSESAPFFSLLLWGGIILFAGGSLLAWMNDCFRGWIRLAPFLFVAWLLLGDSNYPLAPNHSRLLCLSTAFPHYFLGEFALAALLGILAMVVVLWRPKVGLWWLDLVSLLLIGIALIDFRLTRIMGVRLGWDVISFGDSPKMMWRMAAPYLPSVLLGLAAAAAVYFLGVRAWLRWFSRPQAEPSSAPALGRRFAFASFLLLGVLGAAGMKSDKAVAVSALRLIQTSSIWKRALDRPMSATELVRTAKGLGLGDLQAPNAAPSSQTQRDLNVVMVFMESSYNQHLSLFGAAQDTQPLLSKYRDRMELFPNFFSNFAGSIHARFAAFTSLYPVQDFNAFTLQRVAVKSIFEVLQSAGWHCSLFYSSFFDYTGFGDFLKHRGIEKMYDADSMPGKDPKNAVSWGLKEEETLSAMKAQIKKYAGNHERFFMTYVPAAPHYPYDNIPDQFRKFPAREIGDYTPFYLSELLYMDWVLAAIVEELEANGLLDKTMVIITNDHGEMTGANHGHIGHGWAITPELANTPLIIMDPDRRGYHLNYTVGSQVDLLPTVLGRLGVAIPPEELYEGYSLDLPLGDNRPWSYLNSFRQYGVLLDKQIIVGDRENAAETHSALPLTDYAISNQGPRTVFSVRTNASVPAISIQEFDRFQANFLRNYTAYREALRPANVAKSSPSN